MCFLKGKKVDLTCHSAILTEGNTQSIFKRQGFFQAIWNNDDIFGPSTQWGGGGIFCHLTRNSFEVDTN